MRPPHYLACALVLFDDVLEFGSTMCLSSVRRRTIYPGFYGVISVSHATAGGGRIWVRVALGKGERRGLFRAWYPFLEAVIL